MFTAFRIVYILLVTSPILLLLLRVDAFFAEDLLDFISVFVSAFAVSLTSAFIALLFGVSGAIGLLATQKSRKLISALLVLPSFVPSLFVILGVLGMFKPFPFGFIGVVIANTITYSGFIAVILAYWLESRFGSLGEVAHVYGASPVHFFWRVVGPLGKTDLLMMIVFVTTACLGSLAIPMILGGAKPLTLEMFIYEKAVIENHPSTAVLVALIQFSLLFGIGFLTKSITSRQPKALSLKNYGRRFFLLPTLGISVTLLAISFSGAANGFGEFIKAVSSGLAEANTFYDAAKGTVLSCTYTYIFVFAMLSLGILLAMTSSLFRRILVSNSTPSVTAFGVAFGYLFYKDSESGFPLETIALISIVFGLFVLTSLFRLRIFTALENLQNQVATCRVLGASDFKIFGQVIWPQLKREVLLTSGIAAFWISGEFALPSLLTGRELTLALVAKTLISRYQLDLALFVTLVALALGLVVSYGLTRLLNGKS